MISTKFIYSFLELVTFGKGLPKTVNGSKVKLPGKYIRYFPPDYESANFSFLKSCIGKNAVVFDIGAHIGLFSIIAAKTIGINGKVFAFEPAPATTKVLSQTIAINHLENVVIPVNAAIGKEKGTITFFVSNTEADNSNSLVSYKKDRKLNGIEVELNTIDNFVVEKKLTKIDFIKIDVEGAEYDTLLGGKNVFLNSRPACILAIHPEPIEKKGDKLEDIYDFLLQINYHITYQNKPITKAAFCANKEMIDLHLLPV
jgi:FkbM family methyltransferase